MEDREIVALYFARSESAIRETADKFGGLLYRVADNILHCRQDAEEVVADSYLRAWNAIPPSRPRVLKHFLTRITRNLALNRLEYYSAEKRSAETTAWIDELEAVLPDPGGSAESAWEQKELTARLNAFLSELQPQECRVFLLRYYYAESLGEVARRCGLSEGKVKYILLRTRKQLREKLTEEGIRP